MDNGGWISIHKKILNWEWYDDHNVKILFFHMLLKANYKTKKWKGRTIRRGTFVTGLHELAKETGLSVQNVRTSINKLKSTKEITTKSSSKGTVIQIVKYDDYQLVTSQITNNQQTTNKQLTTTNKKNKDNKDNKEYIPFSEFWQINQPQRRGSNTKVSEQKWNGLTPQQQEKVLKHAPRYLASIPTEKYRKLAETYLNQRHWESEISGNENESAIYGKGKWT